MRRISNEFAFKRNLSVRVTLRYPGREIMVDE